MCLLFAPPFRAPRGWLGQRKVDKVGKMEDRLSATLRKNSKKMRVKTSHLPDHQSYFSAGSVRLPHTVFFVINHRLEIDEKVMDRLMERFIKQHSPCRIGFGSSGNIEFEVIINYSLIYPTEANYAPSPAQHILRRLWKAE